MTKRVRRGDIHHNNNARHPRAVFLQLDNPADPPPTSSFSFGLTTPCSFAFSIKHPKQHAEMYGFRFFDLPPEMRNRIYDLSFDDNKHRLSPPGITQANRQARAESLKMFYASVDTLTIPVQTAAQITCLLKWISDRKYRPEQTAQTVEFSYLDPWTGSTTIRLTRRIVSPAVVARECGLRGQKAGSNLPMTTTLANGAVIPAPRLVLESWNSCLGLPNIANLTYCRAYTTYLHPPSDNFKNSIAQEGPWVQNQMTLTGERNDKQMCYCIEPYKFFMKLLRELDGGDLQDTHVRQIAFYLFRLSLRAARRKSKQ